jgi:4-aminobutyrate aminotransferase/(S)-3-amino-2-methylpropionate transaminase
MRNSDILARRSQAIPAGLVSHAPIFVDRADNDELWDVDGRRYIDFAAGIAVVNTGHRHPRVIARVEEQLRRFTHTSIQVCQYESYVTVAERLNALTPTRKPSKTVLFSTGAEAIENAVKIARIATGRTAIVSFAGAFHGRTLMALALTGKVTPYKLRLGTLSSDVHHLPFPMELHGISDEQSIAALDSLLRTTIAPDQLAAIVVEPVQGEGGFYPASATLLKHLRKLCDQTGALLVVDEIQTGFARTGRMFALEASGVQADLMTMAKGLAGGFPLSAVTGPADVMDKVPAGRFGGTYAGSPIACAAALGVLDTIEEENLTERANEIGDRILALLDPLVRSNAGSVIGEIRRIGAMVAIEFVTDRDSNAPNAAMAQAVVKHALKAGLVVITCGLFGNVVRILTPLTIRFDVLEEGVRILEKSILGALSDRD